MYYYQLFYDNLYYSDSELKNLLDIKDADILHKSQDGLYDYRLVDGNTRAVITNNHLDNPTSLEIPTQIDGFIVVGIGKNAFEGLTSLRKLTFPRFIQYFGEGSFNKCSVEELEFPITVKLVCDSAFSNCPNLKDVRGLDYLQHFDPDKLNLGGGNAANYRENAIKNHKTWLKSDIGRYAFYNCPQLQLNRPDLIVMTTGLAEAIADNNMRLFLDAQEEKEALSRIGRAVEENDCESLRFSIKQTPYLINQRFSSTAKTFVFIAVMHDKIKVLKCLASLGASFLAKDLDGNNILHYAVRYSNYKTLSYVAESLKNQIDFNTPNYDGTRPCDLIDTRLNCLDSGQTMDNKKIMRLMQEVSGFQIDHETIIKTFRTKNIKTIDYFYEFYKGEFTLQDMEYAEKILRNSALWDDMVRRCPDRNKRDFDFTLYQEADDNLTEVELNKVYHITGDYLSTAPGLEWCYTLHLVRKDEDLWSFRITDIDYAAEFGYDLVAEGQVDTQELCSSAYENNLAQDLYEWAIAHKLDRIQESIKEQNAYYCW